MKKKILIGMLISLTSVMFAQKAVSIESAGTQLKVAT